MSDMSVRNLAAAIIMQAVRDYCAKKATDKKKAAILKDLRSERMDFITNGMSVVAAEQLELHPKEIAERLRRNSDDMV